MTVKSKHVKTWTGSSLFDITPRAWTSL